VGWIESDNVSCNDILKASVIGEKSDFDNPVVMVVVSPYGLIKGP